jgi:hypothetical protein
LARRLATLRSGAVDRLRFELGVGHGSDNGSEIERFHDVGVEGHSPPDGRLGQRRACA